MPQVQPNAPRTLRQLTIAIALTLPAFGSPQSVSAADTGEQNTAKPQSAALNFNIPAQPLVDALNAFIAASDWQVGFPAGMAKDIRSSAVHGRYTPQQALQQLLTGSGLRYRLTGANTATLENAPQSQADMPVLKAMTVVGETVKDVDDPYNEDYYISNASTATKTDTPIMETPFSIQVVPKQVLEDVQAIRPGDALNYVSGIYQGSANSGDWLDWSRRRGFNNFPTGDYRDGGAFPLASAWGGRDLANIEQVEALKGPASLLFGMAPPGGVVNYVTKKPLATPYYSLQQQFGSYDYYRTTVDATGPITGDKSLLYRFNLAYKDANSFRDQVSSDRVFIAPVVTWNISQRTQVNFELEYDTGHVVLDRGIPAVGKRIPDVPRSRFLGEGDPQSEFERILVGMNWSHAFNDDWSLSHRFTAVYNGIETRAAIPTGVAADGRTVNIFYNYGSRPPENDASYFNTVNLTGHFDTWGLKHTLLIGGDHFRTFRDGIERNFTSTIDLYNPIYLGADAIQDRANNAPLSRGTTLEQWYGLYLQDQIQLPFNLHLLAGMRYDNVESKSTSIGRADSANPESDNLSPRGGLVWQPIPELSLYGSYSENFTGINGTATTGGALLKPETAQQWEVGMKTELFDKRFLATLAWFDLTKQNARIPDPIIPGASAAIGEANVTGLELDVKGEILPGWSMIGSYAYTPNAETTIGSPSEIGERFPGVPRHGGSLFTTYELQSGALRGLKFGGGAILRSSQTTETTNRDVVLPGYATVNLLTSYAWKIGGSTLTTQFNVNNLLDKEYFPASAFSRNGIEVGAPRTFMGSVRIEY
jgi:iron complex outermembrane receptor protein